MNRTTDEAVTHNVAHRQKDGNRNAKWRDIV